jgi:hypothetical protein
MRNCIECLEIIDDLPLSPEAFRVYFSVVRHVVENETFPTVQQITEKCFGRKYASGKTHTRRALSELIKFGLVSCDIDTENYSLIHPDKWEVSAV